MNTTLRLVYAFFLVHVIAQSAPSQVQDFSFWNTSGDSITVAGVNVSLSGSNIDRFGTTGLRDAEGHTDATFIFTFDQPILSFRANFVRVADFETINNFNIAPAAVDGDLLALGNPIVAVIGANNGDFNTGAIEWIDSGITEIQFSMANANGAIGIESFELTPIPEPTAISLAALGLIGLIARGRRRRTR